MKKYLFIALLALIMAVGVMGYVMDRQHKSLDRLRHNQELLLADMYSVTDSLEHYRTKSRDYAVSIGILELTKGELERNCTRLRAEVKDLGIKLKRVEQATTTATQSNVDFSTQVRDSIVYVRDTTGAGHLDTLRQIQWQDPWVTFRGELRGDSLTAQLESRDTLLQVIHRVPHKWWFFTWGTKEIRQEIKTSNPHTVITYAESIQVK